LPSGWIIPRSRRAGIGGGIYRNVWLVKTPPLAVGHWGTYVTTPEVNENSATVKVKVNLDNATGTDGLLQ